MARDVDVVLFGATGYTGRLIAHALDRFGASYAIAGRDAARLDALARVLDARPGTIVADAADPDALLAMASRGRVLLSAAGPFARLGPPVVRAAMAAGTHFADITGEQSFLRWCLEHDEAARDARIAIVNALGFDVVPSDLASVLACRGLFDVDALDLCIAVSDSRMSRGTRRSMAASGGHGAWYDDGVFRSGPPGRFRRSFELPDPWGTRDAVFIPWGDVVTAPRSTGARTVRTFFAVGADRARAMHLVWPLTALVGRASLVRNRLEARAAESREGPTLEQRGRTRFTIVGEATASNGAVQRSVVRGRDPYGLTGESAARAAVALARGEVGERGVLTPSQAFDVEAFCKGLDAYVEDWSAF